MNRIDRLTGILIRLQGQPQTAGQLADRFEVSPRTILRDIDALSQIGVPIIATTGRNGGYQIADDFWLPPLHLTTDEATILLLALDHLGDEASSPLGPSHRTVREKVRSSLRPVTRKEVATNLRSMHVTNDNVAPSASTLTKLRSSVEKTQWIEIDYAGVDGSSKRLILPTLVYVANGRWYTRAVDMRRFAVRHFRIDRIEHARSVPEPADAVSIIQRATAESTPYADAAHPEVRARLTPKGRIFALDHPDLRDAVGDGEHGGELVFRCPPGELPYYGREFLRFGKDIQVEAPPALRLWMVAQLQDLLQHHAPDDGS